MKIEFEDETSASIARAEAAIARRNRTLPLWTLGFGVVGALSLALVGAQPFIWGIFGAGMAFFLAFAFWGAMSGAQKARKRWAQEVWEQLGNAPPPLMSDLTESTRRLGTRIQRIYEDDPNGLFLPLPQAAKLITVYAHQEERGREIEGHLEGLEQIRQKLVATARELHTLAGDDAEALRERSRLDSEIHALQTQKAEIEASCQRLEEVVEKLELEGRQRKLRGEVKAIAHETAGLKAEREAFEAMPEDTGELERQISHEIGIYRQLERETETNLG